MGVAGKSVLFLDGDEVTREALEDAVADADLRVLLMVMFQVSGDRHWLDAPYRPSRDVSLIADESAGFSEALQAEIRVAAVDLLMSASGDIAIPCPDNDLMVEMMSTCLSEAVPPEYAPMMCEQMGFVASAETEKPPFKVPSGDTRPVVIVGAGASGIALGFRLKQLGVPFVIIERNDEVGGTWYENVYPGCAVDTPNHAYSFSFGQRYPWSRNFSQRAEIQDYLEGLTDELDLRARIRFATTLTKAAWDDDANCWRVTLSTQAGEEQLDARAVVSAIGQLSQVSMPDLNGASDYKGAQFHTARWPADLDLAD